MTLFKMMNDKYKKYPNIVSSDKRYNAWRKNQDLRVELRASEMVPKYIEDLCFLICNLIKTESLKNILDIKIYFDTKSNFQIIDF